MNYKEVLDNNPLLTLVAKVAQEAQLETYVVGGFVRDLILKRPSKDIDIVCVGSGIELAQQVSQAITGNPQVNYFKNFGTAQIKTKDWELEFVGARKESLTNETLASLL